MNFDYSLKVVELRNRLISFMGEYIYPNEKVFYDSLNQGDSRWQIPPIMEELKALAKKEGLWNLFLLIANMALNLIISNMRHLQRLWKIFDCLRGI